MDSADLFRMEQLAKWLEQNENSIPNCNRLIHKLRNNKTLGHLVNAEFVKRFYDNGTYSITDVEASNGTYDIDIQLNGIINIQTWHGQGSAGHIMEAEFDPNGRKRNAKLSNISPRGGVRTDWDGDEKVLFRKLNQLPHDKLGIVLLHERFVGFAMLPDWIPEIPKNKCVIKFFHENHGSHIYGMATVYHSQNFQHMDEAKKIITALGYNFKGENPPF